MKQVIQNYKTGELKVEEVPSPIVRNKGLLVRTMASLISAGTERTKVETARMNVIEKAISRLDLVKILLNNIKQEGLIFTLKKAFNKLDTPISLGYSCAGEIIGIGESAPGFAAGGRVACVGEIHAAHSEINSVPVEFAVAIPEGVGFEQASFVGLGAIALNSVELAQIKEKENVVVIGMGLLGQIAVQILKAKGCRVLGLEIDEYKLILARQLGLDAGANPLKDDIETMVNDFSAGAGADAVIITAASKNNLPIEIAGKISRDKGRVILVGAMPINIPRAEYYEKELYFVVSRGFGAGLYCKVEKDRWYPYDYRPITVKENMQNFLSLLADKKINVSPLITHRFGLTDAAKAYELIKTNKENFLGIVFRYEDEPVKESRVFIPKKEESCAINIGFIGAGSFAQSYLLPSLRGLKDVSLHGVATATGINAKNVARKFGFKYCSTDYNKILNDKEINCVFIATRHNLHAGLVVEALKKGKNIFVEKPLCVKQEELRSIIDIMGNEILLVGFNRRFSPFIRKAKEFFENRAAPLVMNYRINAGYLPPDHWAHDAKQGGGRIIGEVCHFVDLLQYFAGALPVEVSAVSLDHPDKSITEDNILVTLKFADGSIGTINYNSIGDVAYPRERIEVFGENSVAVVDNFKAVVLSRGGRTQKMSKFTRDMGHVDEIKCFIKSLIEDGAGLIPFKEIVLTTLTTFKILESIRNKSPVKINTETWIKDV